MTTPAVNINVQQQLSYPLKITDRFGKITYKTVNVRGEVRREMRGASVSSPVRGDGTRAPKAWANVGWFGRSGIVPFHFTTRFDGSRLEFEWGDQSLASADIAEAPGHDIRSVEIATNKLLLNLKDQKIDLGTALSQAKQTIQMVTAVGKDIVNQIDRFQRNHAKEWKRVLQRGKNNASGRYLEVVYGWKPMIDDVDGACNELARLVHEGHDLQLSARGSGKIENTRLVAVSGSGGFERRTISQDRSSAHMTIVMYAPNWVLQDLSRLGLTNPFVVGWENLPYSHVVDWAVPIGNWLNTFDSGAFLRFKEGSRSMIARSNYQYEYSKQPNAQILENAYHVVQPPRGYGWRFDRHVLTGLPGAYFPRLRNPLTLNHMAEALTMLVQKFRVPASRINIRF